MSDRQTTRRTVLQATATGAIGALAGCGVLGGGGGSGGGGSWTNLDGDAGNSGANTATSGPGSTPEPQSLYEPSTFSGFSTVPLVDGSTIAVWGTDDALHGVDTDGNQQWRYSVEMDYAFTNVSPAFHDGVVYLPATDGNLVAVSDGEREWAISPPLDDLESPRVDDDGLYLGGENGLATYDHDGTERWTATDLEGDVRGPAVDESHLYHFRVVSTGFFSPDTWHVVARNLSDGSVDWERESVAGGVVPVVADGQLYGFEGTEQGVRLVALSTSDGSTLWRSDPLGENEDVTPAVTEDAIFVAASGEIHALDPADGSALWDRPYTALDSFTHSPRADGDRVYVLLGNQTVAAIDAGTGQEAWSFGFDNSISWGGVSNLTIANGSLYASRDGLVELR